MSNNFLNQYKQIYKQQKNQEENIMLEKYPDILNSKQIMEILDISKELLYKMIKNKRLPCYRLCGKDWRFNKEALIAHIHALAE